MASTPKSTLCEICATNKKALYYCKRFVMAMAPNEAAVDDDTGLLHVLCTQGDLLLENLRFKDREGRSALDYALMHDDLETFEYLFETLGSGLRSLILSTSENGNTMFHLAAIYRAQRVGKYLAQILLKLNKRSSQGDYLWIVGIIEGVKNARGESVLECIAKSDDNVGMLREFEKAGVRWNASDSDLSGRTPFVLALVREQFLMADELLGIEGTNPNTHEALLYIRAPNYATYNTLTRRVTGPNIGISIYMYTLAGLVASHVSLDLLRYLYARNYDFEFNGQSKMDIIVQYMLTRAVYKNEELVEYKGFHPAFGDTYEIFQRYASQYAKEQIESTGRRLIPSLHTLCMRTIVFNRLDRSSLPVIATMVRDDLGKEIRDLDYDFGSSASTVDRKKRKAMETSDSISKKAIRKIILDREPPNRFLFE